VVTKLLVRSGLLVENPAKDMPDAPLSLPQVTLNHDM
jgi:hypothetical protein